MDGSHTTMEGVQHEVGDRGRTLIADDEASFLVSISDSLSRRGYACDCAPNAETAEEMLQTGDYSLLVCDIRMPGNTNLQFVEEVPNIAESLPIILVTGYPSLETAVQSVRLPVVGYLIKPFEIEELLALARPALARYEAYRAVCRMDERLDAWREALVGVKTSMSAPGKETTPVPIRPYLDLTMQNISASLADLRNLAERSVVGDAEADVCSLFDCPRLDAHAAVMRQAIEVLAKTKRAFKSQELGNLRKDLEAVVDSGLGRAVGTG